VSAVDPFLCPPRFVHLDADDLFVGWSLTDGDRGIGRGKAKGNLDNHVIFGFEPFFDKAAFSTHASRLLWKRPIVHANELTASVSYIPDYVTMAAGRAVTGYELASGVVRLLAVDVQTGRTLWEAVVPPFVDFALSPTRLYVSRWLRRVDVRDAATGVLLGGVGKPYEGRIPRAVEYQ
jgi:hypothetical protein